MTARRWIAAALLVVVASPLAGCAYYNTFYLARKNYDRAINRMPYPLERTDVAPGNQLTKSIEYSKKVITGYPKSKWVDDARLLWAKALIATDDPRQAVRMLEEFPREHPKSGLQEEARFYLGVAYRQSRKYERALAALDTFLLESPRHDLAPYAHYERARTLMSLKRPAEAADAAGQVLESERKGELGTRALVVRADARFGGKDYEGARQDFRTLGTMAPDDDTRLHYLLRETESLEMGAHYGEALRLLNEAIAYERTPMISDTTGGRPAVVQATPGYDRWGRLKIRMGTVLLRSGRTAEALDAYSQVVRAYPRTPISAEAQYRIGYALEVASDDFEQARAEYARVKDQSPGSPFADQAQQRVASLDRLAQFRTAGGDSTDRRAEAEFMLAEQYLFQLDQPERAAEQYQKIEREFPQTPHAAKAIAARGWVMGRMLERPEAGDSLFWIVVREHPGTEAQLAARDYLELRGATVPADLIRLPEAPPAPVDTFPELTPTPMGATPLGVRTGSDSLRLGVEPGLFGPDTLSDTPPPSSQLSPRDSLVQTSPAAPDTSGPPAPPDTSGTMGAAAVGALPDTSRTTGAAASGALPDTSRTTGGAANGAPRDTSRTRSATPPDTASAQGSGRQ